LNRRIKIFLISSILIFVSFLFFHPISNLLGNIQKDYSSLIGRESTFTIPEPVIMFLIGFGLIGIGAYTRRRFLKKEP